MSIEQIKEKIFSNKRLTRADGIKLFKSNDLLALGRMAEHVAQKKNGNRVYFVQNKHINPTNICVNRCKFCAFSRSKGEPGAYEMSINDILDRARSAGKGGAALRGRGESPGSRTGSTSTGRARSRAGARSARRHLGARVSGISY